MLKIFAEEKIKVSLKIKLFKINLLRWLFRVYFYFHIRYFYFVYTLYRAYFYVCAIHTHPSCLQVISIEFKSLFGISVIDTF